MKEFSVPMAIVDYIPVIFFLMANRLVIKDCRARLHNAFGCLYVLGVFLVFCAGFLKATYKLLYALGIGDFVWMSSQMFSNQALGFLLAGVGLVICLTKSQGRAYSFLPTMALVGMMVIGLAAMDAALCFTASKMKKRGALICFIFSFFLSMGMGYLSSKDFAKASMNWIAQGVNLCGQLLLWIGVTMLDKAGLKNY